MKVSPPLNNCLAVELLKLSPGSAQNFTDNSDLIEIAPVVLPEGDLLLGKNDHFGWPVATMAGKALIVVFHRKPQHWGDKDLPDANTSTAVVVRSTDGGRTWSAPLNLKDCVKRETSGCRLGFGNTIGLDSRGRPLVVTSFGVFRSEDEGATWNHLEEAFGENQLSGPVTNNGPVLLRHPVKGLVAPGHPSRSGRENSDGTPFIAPELWLRMSRDDGETWSEEKVDLPDFATAIEPTLLWHEGLFLVVARCHGAGVGSFEPERGTWRYVQLWSHAGWHPLEAKFTTMRATGQATGWHGPWTQDTVDLSWNPVSNRIEALTTNRGGGGPQNEQEHVQTLNLWSIGLDEVDSADWKFETTLLSRDGTFEEHDDGMHPGGAVIDTERGVQHIFIYAGRAEGPSGIFRITRSLDTGLLN